MRTSAAEVDDLPRASGSGVSGRFPGTSVLCAVSLGSGTGAAAPAGAASGLGEGPVPVLAVSGGSGAIWIGTILSRTLPAGLSLATRASTSFCDLPRAAPTSCSSFPGVSTRPRSAIVLMLSRLVSRPS
ncbi:MAG: hypothetical protein HY720_00730 [Planctomycetes bacterium]|nr:hypothetical protein [Planctomycetota bacterium]